MKRWQKATLATGGAAIVLGACAVTAIHVLVDPERLKTLARDKARTLWSRDLAIGSASLQLFPLPAVYAENVVLANPPWAKERNLVEADSMSARIALLPLLVGKVRIKSLELEGVRASLETRDDGARSWDLVGAKSPASREGVLDLTEVTIANAEIHQRSAGTLTVWSIAEVRAAAGSGWRDARMSASVSRKGRSLRIEARFDDLSRIGRPGATSEGQVDLDWGKAQLAIAGRLPLDADARGYALTVDLKAEALSDMLAFFGTVEHKPRVPFAARLEMRDAKGDTEITRLAVALGNLKVAGEGRLSLRARKPVYALRLETPHLDWAQATYDAGGPVIGPLPENELFRDHPLAWPLLVALQGKQGTLETKIGTLRLRNGVELRNARAHTTFDGDRMSVSPFTAETLGGSASGSLLFEGRRKSVKVSFSGSRLLLERWFGERGSKIPLTGGPMRVEARFDTAGDSMKALAAAITGTIAIRMGPAVWASPKAGEAERKMTHAFAGKADDAIRFDCVGATMPFKDGVATADPIVGFRTTASDLITRGTIDMRAETLELRGRLRPRAGTVGWSAVAGDMLIEGPIRKPHMAMDPAAAPAAVARGAAALATLGLSIVGTSAHDAAESKANDPCAV